MIVWDMNISKDSVQCTLHPRVVVTYGARTWKERHFVKNKLLKCVSWVRRCWFNLFFFCSLVFCRYLKILFVQKSAQRTFKRMIRTCKRALIVPYCLVQLYAVCICVYLSRRIIFERVKWIDPVNPSMTLPIFILKSTVWRINKSDEKSKQNIELTEWVSECEKCAR